ncbi:MAG: hypothetical protein ABDH20_12025 [Thermus sp.]
MCARLVRALEFTPWHRLEYERCYEGLGEPEDNPVERARRFFVVSWQGIGGVGGGPYWRHVRHAGYHDVPSHAWSFEHLLEASRRLRRVQFEHRDALEVLAYYDGPETLHYVDPPYLLSTRSRRVREEVERGDEAWRRGLLEVLLGLKGMVVLSGHPSPLYEEVLEGRGWTRVETLARGNGQRRGDRVEALWLSPEVVHRLGRLF